MQKWFQRFRHYIYLPSWRIFSLFQDWKRGVKTEDTVSLASIGIAIEAREQYQTEPYPFIKKSIRLAQTFIATDTFLDIGCGMGRPLIVAHELGFKKLYGVDISSELLKTADSNLSSLNCRYYLACADVDDYKIPPGEKVIYLFNPFAPERVARLLKRLLVRYSLDI